MAPLPRAPARLCLPSDVADVVVRLGPGEVRLTHLGKVFWPEAGHTKRDLLQYYADVAPLLLPHLRDRPMVMRRYPDGIDGSSFFMKQAPQPRPPWVATAAVPHASGKVVEFPLVQDLASLLWVVNLGCIDLNPWSSRADDVDHPDYLHFDLDPGAATPFPRTREAALIVHEALDGLKMPSWVKTTGSRGLHVYVPIVRGPSSRDVWTFAKALAEELARRHPRVLTVVYNKARRPADRVLVDYNQNAWGQTLASIYSVRPNPRAAVSTPVTWDEVRRGFAVDDFRLDNVGTRFRRRGDLWKGLLAARGRVNLGAFL